MTDRSKLLALADDGVRRVVGGTPMAGSNKDPIVLHERDASILVYEGYRERFVLTSESARFLAKRLNELALRIEKRAQAEALA